MSENNQTEEKLTLEQVVDKIKGLISRSALAKIEIGELLNEYTSEIEHGGKEAFYKSIGMRPTTAQYYMKIASNSDVQKLKSEGKLDGLNMSEILRHIGARINVRGDNNENAPQAEQTYTPLGFGNFNFEKCRSTKEFKVEYEDLSKKVSELEAKIAEYQGKAAKAS